MSSNSGIRDGEFDRITLSYDLAVGDDANFGTEGQVLMSGGENEPLTWGSNSASLPASLFAGTDISITRRSDGTNLGEFTGLVEANVNWTGADTTLNLIEGDGISIVSSGLDRTISARVDSDTQPTLRNDYNSNELQVLRVPNNLTVNLGLEYQTGTSYDGSAQRTLVTKVDSTTIDNQGGDGFDELNVKKVPNTLTITDSGGTSVVYDGSAPKSITINDNNTEYTGVVPIVVNNTDDEIGLDFGDTLTINGDDNLSVVKVPNTLTITDSAGTSVVFDGSSTKSITINDNNTEYTAGNGIQISGSNIIQTKTDNQTIRDSGGGSGNNLEVIKVPNALTIIDSAGTSVVYDGETAKSITINDNNTEYTATAPINITSEVISLNKDATLTTISDNLSVVKVPNALTITKTDGTDVVFDGTSAESITLTTDTGITDLNEGDGINITDVSATEKTISANIDTNTLEFKTDTLGAPEPKEIAVKKLPHTLTITDSAGTSVVFDGDVDKSITINDNNTEYTGTAPIVVDNIADTISLNKDATLTTISNNLSVVKVPNALTITKTDGTDVVFDGTSAENITLTTDTGITTLNGGDGITITDVSATEKTISVNADGTTLSNNVGSGQAGVLKVPYSLTTSSTGNTTADIRIQYASGTGTTYDGSAVRRFRVRNTGFAVEVHPNTDTTYNVYRRRYYSTLTYPRQTIDYFYPIDTNFYYNNLPRISTEASGDFEVDVSFCMNIDTQPSVNERLYVRLDTFTSTSYPSYGNGIVEPQVASMIPSGGSKNTARYNVKFLVRLGVSDASYGFYPAVAQYSSSGTDDTQNNTADILYGQTWGSLIMTIKPLDSWVGKITSSNPFTIPSGGDDY